MCGCLSVHRRPGPRGWHSLSRLCARAEGLQPLVRDVPGALCPRRGTVHLQDGALAGQLCSCGPGPGKGLSEEGSPPCPALSSTVREPRDKGRGPWAGGSSPQVPKAGAGPALGAAAPGPARTRCECTCPAAAPGTWVPGRRSPGQPGGAVGLCREGEAAPEQDPRGPPALPSGSASCQRLAAGAWPLFVAVGYALHPAHKKQPQKQPFPLCRGGDAQAPPRRALCFPAQAVSRRRNRAGAQAAGGPARSPAAGFALRSRFSAVRRDIPHVAGRPYSCSRGEEAWPLRKTAHARPWAVAGAPGASPGWAERPAAAGAWSCSRCRRQGKDGPRWAHLHLSRGPSRCLRE